MVYILINLINFVARKVQDVLCYMLLSSLDYSDLLRFLAYTRQGVVLNKTQVNKLLFMCYGTYLSKKNDHLFEEKPKAWPFGPVFPRVYRLYDSHQMPIVLSNEKKKEFNKNSDALRICFSIVDKYCHTSAYDLSLWSHKEGSPWYQTVYSKKPIEWNKEIADDIIKKYFHDQPVI